MTTLSPNIYNETQRWRTLYEITRALYVAPGATFRDTLQNVLEQIGRFTGLSLGCVMTFRENGVLNDAFTLDTLHLGNTLWEHLFNKGLIGYVYHGARTIIIRDIQHDPRFPMPPAGVPAPTGGSAIGIPLMAEEPVRTRFSTFDPRAYVIEERTSSVPSEAFSVTTSPALSTM
jgi:transcriptional regulator with GAF, ATPase, and Fis domain